MIRLATPEDAAAVRTIYAPIVERTAISFEWQTPSTAEMAERIARTLETHPWLVFCEDAEVLGYAYASPYRSRAAYQWSAEVTVYVRSDAQRRGVGSRLYRTLFAVLAAQGYAIVYAAIALPNPTSVALHERLGFEPVGRFPAAGYKHGHWHDVGWWRHSLQEPSSRPAPPIPPSRLRDSAQLEALLRGTG
jgi:L-amino acid N-acyltransferase YncA